MVLVDKGCLLFRETSGGGAIVRTYGAHARLLAFVGVIEDDVVIVIQAGIEFGGPDRQTAEQSQP